VAKKREKLTIEKLLTDDDTAKVFDAVLKERPEMGVIIYMTKDEDEQVVPFGHGSYIEMIGLVHVGERIITDMLMENGPNE
jgi:hypothetical protein